MVDIIEPVIAFVPSAFAHGVSEERIRHALLRSCVGDGILVDEVDDNRYAAIGFDQAGNLLEVMYNLEGWRNVRVFHAMKCRRQYREMVNL